MGREPRGSVILRMKSLISRRFRNSFGPIFIQRRSWRVLSRSWVDEKAIPDLFFDPDHRGSHGSRTARVRHIEDEIVDFSSFSQQFVFLTALRYYMHYFYNKCTIEILASYIQKSFIHIRQRLNYFEVITELHFIRTN